MHAHRTGCIEEDGDCQILLRLESSDEHLPEPGPELMVDLAEVVTRHVFAIVGEVEALTEVTGSVSTGVDRANAAVRHHREPIETTAEFRLEQHQTVGVGMASSTSAMSSSAPTPSAMAS